MKILYVTTVSMTMDFFPEHFKMLLSEGHSVELACSCDKPVSDRVASLGLTVHHLPFSRSPLALSNIRAAKELKQLVRQGNYDIVHCHTPNAALAATVHVGDNTHIGIGTTVKNNIDIYAGCTIGAGVLMVKDITKAETYIGVPAYKKITILH